MDRIIIEALEVDTVIGIRDWERRVRQRVLISFELAWDTRRAAATGDIHDALDYAAVAQVAQNYAASARCCLIEELAEGLASLIYEEFTVPWLRLRVDKPGALPNAHSVAVVIERGNL
ncbi:MAG: dihydroneopterin aldolase [Gammaproteobacteria bacterium]|nr:MAG: dihydroneopterin aldolase [Gammaproteobacteria bacterium]